MAKLTGTAAEPWGRQLVEITRESADELLTFEKSPHVLGASMGFESDTTGPAECTSRERFRTHRRSSGGCWQWRPGLLARGVHPDGTAERDSDGSHERGLVDLLTALANSRYEVQRLLAMADDWRSD